MDQSYVDLEKGAAKMTLNNPKSSLQILVGYHHSYEGCGKFSVTHILMVRMVIILSIAFRVVISISLIQQGKVGKGV